MCTVCYNNTSEIWQVHWPWIQHMAWPARCQHVCVTCSILEAMSALLTVTLEIPLLSFSVLNTKLPMLLVYLAGLSWTLHCRLFNTGLNKTWQDQTSQWAQNINNYNESSKNQGFQMSSFLRAGFQGTRSDNTRLDKAKCFSLWHFCQAGDKISTLSDGEVCMAFLEQNNE